MSHLVQYIIVNAQLKKCLHWSSEKIIVHCCNATSAVIHTFLGEDNDTRQYVSDNNQMRKIVLQVTVDWNTLIVFFLAIYYYSG